MKTSDKEKTQYYKSGFECGKQCGMARAIDILKYERTYQAERLEQLRQEKMKAHVAGNYDKRRELEQLSELAIDTIFGLDYAIAKLMGSKE
jgi:hypothetical protein